MNGSLAEVPVLGVLHKLDRDELPLDDLVDEGTRRELERRSPNHWVRQVIEHTDPTNAAHAYWIARLLVTAVQRGDARFRRPAEDLAAHLLSRFEALGRGSTDHRALVQAIGLLRPGEPIDGAALEALGSALRGVLDIAGGDDEPQVLMSGSGAELATLILELATNELSCTTSTHVIDVGGKQRPVTFVEVDCCTNRSFDDCRWAIDPRAWPAANPFFRSVTVLGAIQQSGLDWCGRIKERVGPGINGKVYETDLDVTYVERPGMAVTAFDLAQVRTDPGQVTVDRGFVSCTDEGIHRRIRTLKVYRIEDLTVPPTWVCPLWSSQLALAAFWSA